MRTLNILLTLLIMLLFSNCSSAQELNDLGGSKMLIVYYSWSGNTETLAYQIQSITGAEIFSIELEEPYSDDYSTVGQQYRDDNRVGNIRKLVRIIENIQDYDMIFLGAPIWGGTRALPVKSFLAEHNLSGITIAPFTTHGGGGAGRCFTDMQVEAPGATFTEGLSISGNQAHNSRQTIERWLSKLGINE